MTGDFEEILYEALYRVRYFWGTVGLVPFRGGIWRLILVDLLYNDSQF